MSFLLDGLGYQSIDRLIDCVLGHEMRYLVKK